MVEATGPLEGIRVVEFAQAVAGPICGLILSDLGADVIKVEPLAGDYGRRGGSVVPGESKTYQSHHRGKRSIRIDLGHEQARDAAHRLIATSDVVITNFRPGVAARLQIDYAAVSRVRADIIYWQNTGFGETGPMADLGGSDMAAAAYAGLTTADAKVDELGAPARISAAPIVDYSTGIAAAMGVCAALLHRERTGQGQRITTSLLQTALFLQAPYVMREPVTDATLRDPMMEEIRAIRARGGRHHEILEARENFDRHTAAFRVFYSGYEAKDGSLVLGALTRANRDGVRRLVGIEDEESDDPDYDGYSPDAVARAVHWKSIVSRRLKTRTVSEWLADFAEAGVPAAAVQVPEEMSDDPQVRALGLMADVEHEVTGAQQVVGPIINMERSPTRARAASASAGRDTSEVLLDVGLSKDQIDALRAANAVL